jgi:hypothetical protein
VWGLCGGGVEPVDEICNNGIDDDCDGDTDEGCVIDVEVHLDGDCLTASCPPQAPYPIGCDITMAGGDSRGCVASTPTSSTVYFQEGNACGAGKVTGTLKCSSQPGAKLDQTTCAINKSDKFFPDTKDGCPDT